MYCMQYVYHVFIYENSGLKQRVLIWSQSVDNGEPVFICFDKTRGHTTGAAVFNSSHTIIVHRSVME